MSRPPSPLPRSPSRGGSPTSIAPAPGSRASIHRRWIRVTSGCRSRPLEIDTPDGLALPAWWIPARGGAPGPAVVLVHGWESGRHRTLPNASFLNAAGYHVLTFDVRGHGANPAEELPVSAGEFGSDALAAIRVAVDRPDVTAVAVLGHSMGGDRRDPRRGRGRSCCRRRPDRDARRSVSPHPPDVPPRAPPDPRPDRLPARLAHDAGLPPAARARRRRHLGDIGHPPVRRPDPGDPRHRRPGCAGRPTSARLAAAARSARTELGERAAPVETLVIPGGQHSWMYEFPAYREAIARFLAAGASAGPSRPTKRPGSRRRSMPAGRRTTIAASGRSTTSTSPWAPVPGPATGRRRVERGGLTRMDALDAIHGLRVVRRLRRSAPRTRPPDGRSSTPADERAARRTSSAGTSSS